ncbi:hypothetical protein AB1N83_009938 [Pleurotus pulmonarius]
MIDERPFGGGSEYVAQAKWLRSGNRQRSVCNWRAPYTVGRAPSPEADNAHEVNQMAGTKETHARREQPGPISISEVYTTSAMNAASPSLDHRGGARTALNCLWEPSIPEPVWISSELGGTTTFNLAPKVLGVGIQIFKPLSPFELNRHHRSISE